MRYRAVPQTTRAGQRLGEAIDLYLRSIRSRSPHGMHVLSFMSLDGYDIRTPHGTKTIARRRRRNQIARASRRRNRS